MTVTLIHNGTLIDGNGGAPRPNVAVLREGTEVKAVGVLDQLDVPPNATRVNAQGGSILSGLIDMHVHLMFEGIEILDTW